MGGFRAAGVDVGVQLGADNHHLLQVPIQFGRAQLLVAAAQPPIPLRIRPQRLGLPLASGQFKLQVYVLREQVAQRLDLIAQRGLALGHGGKHRF